MAIGLRVTVDGINNQAGSLAERWHKLLDDMKQFTDATSGLSAANLQALGFSAPDSTAMVAIISNMKFYVAEYYGVLNTLGAVNYDAAFLPVRGVSL